MIRPSTFFSFLSLFVLSTCLVSIVSASEASPARANHLRRAAVFRRADSSNDTNAVLTSSQSSVPLPASTSTKKTTSTSSVQRSTSTRHSAEPVKPSSKPQSTKTPPPAAQTSTAPEQNEQSSIPSSSALLSSSASLPLDALPSESSEIPILPSSTLGIITVPNDFSTAPTPTDTSTPLVDPLNSPTDDPSTLTADQSSEQPSATSAPTSFLSSKGAVAGVSTVAALAGIAAVVSISIFFMRRRSRQRRRERWERKSHVWVDTPDHGDDGMRGFEKMDGVTSVPMGSMSNAHLPRSNETRDYFASTPSLSRGPSQSESGHGRPYSNEYSGQHYNREDYGANQQQGHGNEYPDNTYGQHGGVDYSQNTYQQYDGATYSQNPYQQHMDYAQNPYQQHGGIEYPPNTYQQHQHPVEHQQMFSQQHGGIDYPPQLNLPQSGMDYSTSSPVSRPAESLTEEERAKQLRDLYQYTLEPEQGGYTMSPLAASIAAVRY